MQPAGSGGGGAAKSDPAALAPAAAPPAEHGDQRSLTGRAGIVAAGTLASRVLGLGRDLVLAGIFPRAATDAFMVAFTIPNVLRQLLAEGAVQNAVLPVLSKTKELEGDAAARRFFRAARGLSLLILLAVTALGILAAPALVDLFAGGYRRHPELRDRTIELTRWLFPYIFFMGMAAFGMAALNAYRRFAVAAFAPALLNVSFIACALLLPGYLGARSLDPILAMAAGALVGGALQVVAQWPSLKKIGFLERPRLELRHPGVREALRRMGPVLFGVGVYYVDVILARRFLSELDIGAQTYFGFALRLCDFPQGIFVMAIQTATLPSLAALAARGEQRDLEKTFAFGLRLALFVALGATALFVALAEPLVVLVFQRGEFGADAARETARALMAQGAGIWTVAAVRQLVTVYFAVGDTRTPVVVAALDLLVFIALALTLREPLGHVGIGLAVAGSSAAQMLLLWWRLGRHLEDRRTGEILVSAARSLGAAAAGAAAGVAVASALAPAAASGWAGRMVPGLGGAAAFGVTFLTAAWLLRSEELRTIAEAFRRRRRARAA